MNTFEKALVTRITEEVPDLSAITPGLVISVHHHGRLKGLVRMGQTFPYYDLASLTKIIFTASAGMSYFSANAPELKLPVKIVLPWWKGATTPTELLTHSAGLNWWKPYYKRLKGPMVPQKRWGQLKKALAREKPGRRVTHAVYSDLDLWMLGAFLEAAKEQSLLQIWHEVADRVDIEKIFFHPGNKPIFPRAKYAPTEACPWRKKTLRGEVHDENTWALAGVAPHAGLFGSIEAVADWGLKLRAALRDDFLGFGSPAMVRRFVRRQIPPAVGDWGLGFMKPTKGHASCGKYFGLKSFGHTGFTGTSLWMDPVKDLLVVILSNRVHPTRDNMQFAALRPQLHDWICQLL